MSDKVAGLDQLTVPQLLESRREVASLVPDLEAFISGSLQSQRRRCGKAGCRCAEGELHGPYQYLAVRTGRRTRMVYVPAELAEEVRRRVTLGQSVRTALARISAINLELLSRGELS